MAWYVSGERDIHIMINVDTSSQQNVWLYRMLSGQWGGNIAFLYVIGEGFSPTSNLVPTGGFILNYSGYNLKFICLFFSRYLGTDIQT